MWSVDVVATYLYALKFIAITVAVLILISGARRPGHRRRLLGAASLAGDDRLPRT